LFSLPYRLAWLAYAHDYQTGMIHGEVCDWWNGAKLDYDAELSARTIFQPCRAASLNEWPMER